MILLVIVPPFIAVGVIDTIGFVHTLFDESDAFVTLRTDDCACNNQVILLVEGTSSLLTC